MWVLMLNYKCSLPGLNFIKNSRNPNLGFWLKVPNLVCDFFCSFIPLAPAEDMEEVGQEVNAYAH